MAEPKPAQPPPEQIGVVYTPFTDPQLNPPDARDIIRKNVPQGIYYDPYSFDFVRIQWVDLINNIRYRIITNAYFAKLLSSSVRPGVSITKCALGLVFLSLADGFRKAKNELDLSFLIGIESEFILLKQTNPIEAVNNHGWSNSTALPSGSIEAKVLEEIADALNAAGIELQMYHAEAAPGQYEVITGPLGPLQAADALVHTRETIYNIASKHGLRATFAPRVYMDRCGSAAHTHISIHSSTPPSPSISSPNLTSLEASFLAGLLAHLPSLTILTLPLSASYKRMVDSAWSGGTYVCWGTDNREAPIRLCNATSPSSRNFEVKCVDGTSIPYLAFAGLIAAGVEGGVKINRALEMRDCSAHGEVGKTAADMGEEERARCGITERLPLNWEAAREAFRGDAVLGEAFGEAFVTGYLNVNKVRFLIFVLERTD
ncbi:uncharacterized protein LACBIDRAFT_328500 [Laccaria bicolor S238N-H82]|uniref:Predicted protein n=1 Tax=Laccaria bicolor (strain S238N-H82 / ATCC MYA-4686) TaxID=486041 RepID=B0DF14_LACBS|nr:uncharacterized protein LACBIDRAFT_328500 [Laccaria bicolor S238N-H82]EDR06640.1 predicted protein [Laccaria bicolor S238N-H82]|eukprot:XP_001882487.1 predicted protein [Laccaria bicolor S238N-H82]